MTCQPNHEIVHLCIECRNLPRVDLLSQTDPKCRILDNVTGQLIGQTEHINNKANPKFLTSIPVDYLFEQSQQLRFEIYDCDTNGTESSDKPLAMATESLVVILKQASEQTMFAMDMKNLGSSSSAKPRLIVRVDRGATKQEMRMKLQATLRILPPAQLRLGWLCDMMSPYKTTIEFLSNEFPVGASHSVPWNRSANRMEWKRDPTKKDVNDITLTYRVSHKEDGSLPLRVAVVCEYDSKSDVCQSKQSVVTFETSTAALTKAALSTSLPDGTPKKPIVFATRDYELTLCVLSVVEQPSFVDFMSHGMRVHMATAIDFTGSNGDWDDPTSLHYIRPDIRRQLGMVINLDDFLAEHSSVNPYFDVIQAVGRVLEPYCDTRDVAAFGFGAEYSPPEWTDSDSDGCPSKKQKPKKKGDETCAKGRQFKYPNTKQCFSLGEADVIRGGVQNVLWEYLHKTVLLTFKGPTLFAPVLRRYMEYVRRSILFTHDTQNYGVLLIITDGQIDDMQDTIDVICDLADLPVSLVIVGVGNGDFTNMNILDGDDVRLQNRQGRKCSRDIVQFVHFNTHKHNRILLAAEILKEIPRQVLEYAEQRGLRPGRSKVKTGAKILSKLESKHARNDDDDDTSMTYTSSMYPNPVSSAFYPAPPQYTPYATPSPSAPLLATTSMAVD